VRPFYDEPLTDPSPSFEYNTSSDLSYGVFLGVAGGKSTNTNGFTIYRADLRAGSDHASLMQEFAHADALVLPSDSDSYREAPVVSTQGTVLYASLSADEYTKNIDQIGKLKAEDWNMYEVGADGSAQLTTHGVRPKWIDASHFAYLRNDGIYLYDLTTHTEEKVWSSSSTLSIANGFDVSDDSSLVALSDPAAGTLTVIRALNWTGNILSTLTTVSPIIATNLTFSPDDQYLAALVTRDDGSIALEYYSFADAMFISPNPPLDPSIKAFYITDWK